ncbi:hypothetical protein PS900_04179 [Pseudomonas fluorescens]|uniref:OmpR/PhoB-type domain-containing protein n=1 Tax=Pseudomonas fluorescens TaxID=294 RepID=A0A8H2NUK7_PSEFL|nr:winged helix-turn-helix domain-containing protein [Pseudomonas fluorescens]VVP27497.1 hypothetical protein PS900_04179 [Pseudomonas fluorescens]
MLRAVLGSGNQKKHFLIFTRDFLVRHVIEDPLIQSTDHAQSLCENPDNWRFCNKERTLVKANNKILVSGIESLLIEKLLLSNQRVLSKAELILAINRDPERYRGLEMCLSRLQEKFSSSTNGERLFRSVRNRGYCLSQKIEVVY